MPIYGKVKTVVFLVDRQNRLGLLASLRTLQQLNFSGNIYVFSHYLNLDEKMAWTGTCPSIIWQEVGETLAYEKLCDQPGSAIQVTLVQLNELMPPNEINYVCARPNMSTTDWNKKLETQMNIVTYWKQRTEKLVRQYSHRPRYMAWRILWVSFAALFLKSKPYTPPAQGIYRDIQLAGLKILKEIDWVCKQAGLVYWIDFGTLLGAVRHGGFIPWDDDIDISMPRQDYEHFADIFNKSTRDKRLSASLFLNNKRDSVILKVRLHGAPNLFVDIFPIDFCAQTMTDRQKLDFTEKIKKLAHRPAISQQKPLIPTELYARCMKLRERLPHVQNRPAETAFYGVDFFHATHLYNAFDYATIFPLQLIKFEGNLFPTVAKPDFYLRQIFGNYKQLPNKLHFHFLSCDFSTQEQKILQEYIKPL